MLQLKGWVEMKIHPIGVEDLVLSLEECENSHTLTTITTGSTNSQTEVNNQIDNQNQCSVPTKGPIFTGSWSCLMSSARHTLSNNTQLKNLLRPVNLSENDV